MVDTQRTGGYPSKPDPIHKVGRAGSRRLPIFRAAALGVVAYVVFDVLWLTQGWGGDDTVRAFSNLSAVGCAVLAAVICVRTWRTERRPRRRPWGLLALATAFWAVGEIFWTFYELVLRREVPFPSYADVFYLAAYPLAVVAMLTLPTSPPALTARVKTVLDALVSVGALLFVSWATFLAPLYRVSGGPIAEQVIALSYPIADIVIGAIVVFVVIRAQPGRRMTLVLIALGLLFLAIADSAFAYLTSVNEYATGGAIDAAWDVGYLLIALAALRHDPSGPRPERNDQRRLGQVFPYAAVFLVIAFSGVIKMRQGNLDIVLFWGSLSIILLVIARQLITLLDNVSLTRNLESKVRQRTAALARSEERHRSLVQNSSDVMTIVDREGVITYVSPSSERVLGYPPHNIIGRRLIDVAHPEDRGTLTAYLTRFMQQDGDSPVIEWQIRHADGAWRHLESIGHNLLDDATVDGFVLNTRDISERKELELQLRHQAFHDQLTGSPNRALFRDRADHALRRAARNRKPIAVLYCDLDNLKQVNDRLGHGVGDKLLAAVAERFGSCIRAEDTVARLGGDEFAVLLTDSGNEGGAKHVAGRLLKALDEPFFIDNHVIKTSASIGIAISWGRQEVDELLRNADLAMYAAKNQGKARYELFESATHGSPEQP